MKAVTCALVVLVATLSSAFAQSSNLYWTHYLDSQTCGAATVGQSVESVKPVLGQCTRDPNNANSWYLIRQIVNTPDNVTQNNNGTTSTATTRSPSTTTAFSTTAEPEVARYNISAYCHDNNCNNCSVFLHHVILNQCVVDSDEVNGTDSWSLSDSSCLGGSTNGGATVDTTTLDFVQTRNSQSCNVTSGDQVNVFNVGALRNVTCEPFINGTHWRLIIKGSSYNISLYCNDNCSSCFQNAFVANGSLTDKCFNNTATGFPFFFVPANNLGQCPILPIGSGTTPSSTTGMFTTQPLLPLYLHQYEAAAKPGILRKNRECNVNRKGDYHISDQITVGDCIQSDLFGWYQVSSLPNGTYNVTLNCQHGNNDTCFNCQDIMELTLNECFDNGNDSWALTTGGCLGSFDIKEVPTVEYISIIAFGNGTGCSNNESDTYAAVFNFGDDQTCQPFVDGRYARVYKVDGNSWNVSLGCSDVNCTMDCVLMDGNIDLDTCSSTSDYDFMLQRSLDVQPCSPPGIETKSGGSGGLSTGAIVGIAIGCAAGAAIVAGVGYMMIH